MIKRREKRLCFKIGFFVFVLVLIPLNYLINISCLTSSNKYCSCQKLLPTVVERNATSLCSARATQRGIGQKIIAISFFGPVENPKMFSLNSSLVFLQELIDEMQQVYADHWILRVYHDHRILDQATICHFVYHYAFVDFCNITDLGMDFVPQKIWRFLPAGDETVSIMASRDLDSPLTRRERAAVDEWLLSNLTFHSMRDHPDHAAPIMGGMWGFRVEKDRAFSRILRSKILNEGLIKRYSLNRDQQFLAEHLWPYAARKAMAHASYWCSLGDWNIHHRPFPTQRPTLNVTNNCFIGCPKPCCTTWNFDRSPCPAQCRPKEHQDWTFC